MVVNFFNQPFMTPEIDINYYKEFDFEFLCLTHFDGIFPSKYIFIAGFERFGSMVGALQ